MIIFRQKEFGNKANKQANRDFIINQGLKDSKASKRLEKIKNSEEPGFFEFGKKEKRKDQISKLENYLESKTTKDNILRKYRESNKDVQNLSTPKDRLASLDPSKRKELKKRVNARKLAKEIEERELFESAQREKAEQIRQEASQKAAEERAEFLRSEAKKEKPVTALTALTVNTKKSIGSKTADFIKNNKKALIAGSAGTAAIAGGAILLHRHNKKKKEEEENSNK